MQGHRYIDTNRGNWKVATESELSNVTDDRRIKIDLVTTDFIGGFDYAVTRTRAREYRF
jgi:hypothetical protein